MRIKPSANVLNWYKYYDHFNWLRMFGLEIGFKTAASIFRSVLILLDEL